MSKIFETQFENGSLIDRISKTSLTPVGTQTFKQTEKGKSVLFDGGVSASNACLQSNLKITSVPYTLIINFKYLKNASTSYILSQTLVNDPGRLIIDLQSTNRLEYFIGGDSVLTNPLQNNIWYQAIMIRDSDGVVTCYLNNTYIGTFTNANLPPTTNFFEIGGSTIVPNRTHFGHIQKLIVYNNNISEQERNQLYQEFLQSQPIEKPVRGFELVKPTDLSYLKDTGLVAAYNMIPNGNTLVDISGNGNNGTIVGALRTKDGMSFDGVGSTVITSMTANTDFAGEYTILARIKPRSFGGSNAGRIVDKSEGTSGTKGFYLTLTSPALDIAYNDGGIVLRSTPNIIQLGQEQTIAMTMASNERISFYYNGIAVGTASRAYNYTTPAPLTIGNRAGATDRAFDGEIIDIRIYNRALTEQEIKDYHNSFIKPVILEDWSGSAVGDII